MPVRTARTAWDGGLQDGSGEVELSSSRAGTFSVSFPRRTAEQAEATSPEELIAAAHSSCLAMQLSHEIADAGGTPHSLEVSADVTLGPLKAGGLGISRVALTVRGEVEGLDAAGFEQAAEAAKANCPVSRALSGVEDVTLDAALVQ